VNYTIAGGSATSATGATISKAQVTITSNGTVSGKQFDGTTNATVLANSTGLVSIGNSTAANGSTTVGNFTAVNTTATFANASVGLQLVNLNDALRDTVNYSIAGGSQITTATIVAVPNVSVNTSAGIGLTGSTTAALTMLNSTVTASQIAAELTEVTGWVQLVPTAVDSLPSSEGTTGRGDSGRIPTRINGEINTPIGDTEKSKDGARVFTPISTNAGIGPRAEFCIESGVKMPPEFADIQTCN
jgi:hypothetical protein